MPFKALTLTSPLSFTECTILCSPTCYVHCSTDPDPPPPSPPPPPPPPPLPCPTHHTPSFLTISFISLAVLVVLVSCIAVLVKFRSRFGRTQPVRRNASVNENAMGDDDELREVEVYDDDDDDPIDGNPVWLIATVGLGQSVIERITVVRYGGKEKGLGTECAVCLSEFKEGEMVRVLPRCDHGFHVGCIDTWLRSHTNCPLCRAAIVVSSRRMEFGSGDERSFGHSRRSELALVVESEEIGGVHVVDDFVGTSRIDMNRDRVGIGIDHSSGADLVRDKVDLRLHGHLKDELQMVRRSMSMDHPRCSKFIHPGLESTSSSNVIGWSSVSLNNGLHPHCALTQCDLPLAEASSMARSTHASNGHVNRSRSWSGRISSTRHGHTSKPGFWV